MTRRILQIIPTLDQGGAEKQLSLLATGLDKSRFEVHVCTLTRSGPYAAALAAAGIPLHEIHKRWKLDPPAYWRLEKLIRTLKPDLVQTWLFAANSYGRLAAYRAGVPRIVACERSVDPWKRTYELAIDRWLARCTKRIVVNSTGVRDFYVSRGLPAEKFVLIPNGVAPQDPAALRLTGSLQPVTREFLLKTLQLPADAKLIAAVGRLWPQKQVGDLIWAADLLKVIRPDTHLLILGDGPDRAKLERFRAQVKIEDRVHFLGHRDDVAAILPHCLCLWLASEYEGQPNAILEAMSAGLPVIATDIPGNRDLVVEGETGYLVPLHDRGAFAARTRALLDDPTLATRLGAAGRERVANEFTVPNMVERFATLYDGLLSVG